MDKFEIARPLSYSDICVSSAKIATNAIQADRDEFQSCCEVNKATVDALGQKLQDPNNTHEENIHIVDSMVQVDRMTYDMYESKQERKASILKTAISAVAFVFGAILAYGATVNLTGEEDK